MRSLTLDPSIPLALWVPLALGAAGLWGWYAWASRSRLSRRRRGPVLGLMAVAIVLPLGLLLNPTWLERVPPPEGKPLLTILVDRSASMAVGDAESGRSRYVVAAELAASTARQLADRYEVRIRSFATDSSPAEPEGLSQQRPDGPLTDLAAAIEGGLDQERPQGQALLLLSDGAHNAGGGTARVRQSAAKAKALAAPIFARTFGGPTGVADLEVSLNMPQELAFVGQQVPIVVGLRQRGSLAATARLSLVLDDQVTDRREAKLPADGTTEEVFQVTQNKSGLYRYEVRAEGLPSEVTTLNNTATMLLRVVDQPIRVLLLEGKPYWDTKFLVRTLSADPSIALTSVVRLAEGRLLERRISRPPAGDDRQPRQVQDEWTIQTDAGKMLGDPQALAAYQIVVLGRDAEVFLTDEALSRLKKWLTQGDGSLVCFRGPPASQISQRLGELLPLRWTPSREARFRVKMTGAGQALRWLPAMGDEEDVLAAMPSLATVARPEGPKALAVVLAASAAGAAEQGSPVIAYQPVGSGRVVVVEGAGMWRWAFLPPQQQQRDAVYGQLWRSLVRWLVANVGLLPSQRLALRTDKVTFSASEAATATLLMREGDSGEKVPQIELSGAALPEPRSVTPVPRGSPGQFHVAFGTLPEGRYLARAAGAGEADVAAVAAFEVRGDLKERLDVAAQPGVMRLIAEETGGTVLAGGGADVLAQQFDAHLLRSRPPRTAQTAAWDRWWVLATGFTIWAAAWGIRRRSGLV